MHAATIWQFSTEQFTVALEVYPERDLDISYDIDGSIAEGIQSGELTAFMARVSVVWRGMTIAESYLGNCVYDSPASFRHHSGYFYDMVKEACRDARRTLRNIPQVRAA